MAFVQKFPEDFFCEFEHVKIVFAQTSYLYISFVLVTNIWFLCHISITFFILFFGSQSSVYETNDVHL